MLIRKSCCPDKPYRRDISPIPSVILPNFYNKNAPQLQSGQKEYN
ncbi:Bulb-type lectin domain-containing protein [Psidium guajava]|nr:Bulb-type lectin domain-containing protein [Psidium guajava]